ncbi:hypothetical protein [uncultured Oxalicibacterium sp.]|uniref:hypothetical protein n=1 Tax=uncultured Oxalicibacterium sp. TaxID=1168540 RepID=UPI0025E5220E|nr:hypothetical protein [uncultured Oxalicibacterium sp.]
MSAENQSEIEALEAEIKKMLSTLNPDANLQSEEELVASNQAYLLNDADKAYSTLSLQKPNELGSFL